MKSKFPSSFVEKTVDELINTFGLLPKIVEDGVVPYVERSADHYHNLWHIHNMVNDYKKVFYNNKFELKDYLVLGYAILFHDVVHDIKSERNEYNSSVVAVNSIEADTRLTRKDIGKIRQDILGTSLPPWERKYSLHTTSGVLNLLDLGNFMILRTEEFLLLQNRVKAEYIDGGLTKSRWSAGRVSFTTPLANPSGGFLRSIRAIAKEAGKPNLYINALRNSMSAHTEAVVEREVLNFHEA